MKTKLIRIGNSQGVRIPKPFIEESGLSEEIEMILEDNKIVLRSAEDTRKGWDESFAEMAKQNDDFLFDKEDVQRSSEWDETEWTW
jgi:antitoxin MazE